MSAPLIEVALPAYIIRQEPDHRAVGKAVDDVIRQYFSGQVVVVRGLNSKEHTGKSVDELIEIIRATGTDRYDPKRAGDRYENAQGKHRLVCFSPQSYTANATIPLH